LVILNQAKQSGWRKQLLLWSYILVACLLLRGGFFYQNLHATLELPESDQNPYLILVRNGQSFSQVSNQLYNLGIVKSGFDIRWFARLSGKASQIKAGEYILDEGMSALDVLDKLVKGDIYYRRIRILEGWTLKQALQAIQAHPNIEVTLDIENEDDLQALLASEYYPEGLLFPDTYNFSSGSTDRAIVLRAANLMQQVLAEEWQKRSVGLPYDDSYQALIMASIIEKETGRVEERNLIAGVFMNRLQNNMRLQTDPTVIYGLGESFTGNLTRAHLQTLTPYNTYRINGLPPTPIALPGRDAIAAALNPEIHEYLYFVARGDGSHYFSSTLEEHNAAVERFQLGIEN
tara:strand:+ start:245512 stop:246552 length:1041 start_codon:yes stop_codon:yes gene_type:complete